jgi:phosphoribosylglycinamide formyltransferase 1
MKSVVIITGDELRHKYFRMTLSNDNRFNVVSAYCEGVENSLEARTNANPNSSLLEKLHISARKQSEDDFFKEISGKLIDRSNPVKIQKGKINDTNVVKAIKELNPELVVCYGSSLIKTELLEAFEGRFLNVHLGLSPYYRGSGTNVWPLINQEPFMVGATYMYIDAGIDTGKIIHQVRADIFLGDSSHSIGNRLIKKMTRIYADIITSYENLNDEKQPKSDGKLYKMKDFDGVACRKLYSNFSEGMIERYVLQSIERELPYIVENAALKEAWK